MYLINKIVGWMTSSLAVALVVLLVALVFVWKGKRRPGLWSIGGALAWLWLWATPIMTGIVGAPLEREFLVDGRVPPVESFPDADAIVLLGGEIWSDASVSPYAVMWTSIDRIWQAARLYKVERVDKIIATGNGTEASTLGLLLDFGVGHDDIAFMDVSFGVGLNNNSIGIKTQCYITTVREAFG